MTRQGLSFSAILTILTLLFCLPQSAIAQEQPVVRAVLFYSPTCPHCQQVITRELPPLYEKYGTQLEIAGIDISQDWGHALYQAAVERFAIPDYRLGVPTLIIADVVLVGSLEIPESLPSLIEAYLAQRGVDWPDIPGLREALAQEIAPVDTPTTTTQITARPDSTESAYVAIDTPPIGNNSDLNLAEIQKPNWQEKFDLDPTGNMLSVAALVGMVAALFWSATEFQRTNGESFNNQWSRLIPFLCFIGTVIASYLSYVEVAQVTAVCGPVGDCNTVQQSVYARLFGILPIGLLGVFGYAAILIAWSVARLARGQTAYKACLGLFGMAATGTLFSIYLTFLEPFVIGATCIWCLSSSVLMTVIMVISLKPARDAFVQMRAGVTIE